MSFIPALEYVIGIPVVGFVAYLMNGIIMDIADTGVHQTGMIYSFLTYLWVGSLVIYLVFGGIWVVRKYNEQEYPGGFM